MKLEDVPATVALERMWIYARQLSVQEREALQATLLAGNEVTYTATDREGQVIGATRLRPEQFPVLTVTETTMTEKIAQAIALLQEAMGEVRPWGAPYYACARSIKDLSEYGFGKD